MKLLLAHNSTYYPALGGGDKSNRLLMQKLAAKGHESIVIARADSQRELLSQLAERDIPAIVEEPGIVRFTLLGVEVFTVTNTANLRSFFTRHLTAFQPDLILASTDDPAHLLLEPALDSGAPVVYLARAPVALPFGPDCSFPSHENTETLRRTSGIVAVSEYVAEYIGRWGNMDAVALPISFMEEGPTPRLASFSNEFVTLINPCAVKGIDIFLGLADAMPDIAFAAVPTWGAGQDDIAKLRARHNIALLPPADKIDHILRRTRVLLVPSLWAEARSRMPPEAMLRGVPVIASDSGGLRESMLGVPYVLPVNLIQRYRPQLNEQMAPVAEAPPQNLEPWIEALRRLTSDQQHWNAISDHALDASTRYVREQLRIEPFESFLESRRKSRLSSHAAQCSATTAQPHLDKRSLLALKLRQREWLEPLPPREARTQLICFPYAGAIAPYREWRESLGAAVVRLHAPLTTMEALIADLMRHVAPKLPERFLFFGHSMGAGIAFEFTRELRRAGSRMPEALVVSAATAPPLRLTPATEISPDPEAAFYGRYVYQPGEPLDIPVHVFGAADDPSIAREALEGWRQITTGPFSLQLFEGGHAYVERSPDLQAALARLCSSGHPLPHPPESPE